MITRCNQHSMSGLPSGESCEDCQKAFESATAICGHRWKPVSNSAYFGKRGKSIHIDGKCAEKFEGIPKSFLARRSLAPRHVIVDYSTGNEAIVANNRAFELRKAPVKAVYLNPRVAIVEPEPVKALEVSPDEFDKRVQQAQLIALLAEQNELLRKLAA